MQLFLKYVLSIILFFLCFNSYVTAYSKYHPPKPVYLFDTVGTIESIVDTIRVESDGGLDVKEAITVKIPTDYYRKIFIRAFPIHININQLLFPTYHFKEIAINNNTLSPDKITISRYTHHFFTVINTPTKDIATYYIHYKTYSHTNYKQNEAIISWEINRGNWHIPINRVEYQFIFPPHTKLLYTQGQIGSASNHFNTNHSITENSDILTFINEQPIQPSDDFQIKMGVEKNIFCPIGFENILPLFNTELTLAYLISLLFLIYALFAKSPYEISDTKSPFKINQPPRDLTPGDTWYLFKSDKLLSVIIMSLLVKGFFIFDVKNKIFQFTGKSISTLPQDEKYIAEKLIKKNSLIYQLLFVPILQLLKFYMKKNKEKYGTTVKYHYLISALILNISALICLTLNNPIIYFQPFADILLMLLCGSSITFIGTGLIFYIIKLCSSQKINKKTAIFSIVMVLILLGAGMYYVIAYLPLLYFIPFIFLFFPNYKWYKKTIELSKQEIDTQHELKGFRQYLSEDNCEDTRVFEEYLPYAIALKIEKKWTANFDNIFLKTYFPIWITNYEESALLYEIIRNFVEYTTVFNIKRGGYDY